MPSLIERAQSLHATLLSSRRDLRGAQHSLAVHLAQMERERLHLQLGHASVVEYARLRLDLPPREVRELLRVGRKLARLPRIDAAMAAGEIDLSRVREIVRVATEDTEQAWLERARELNAHQVQRAVAVTHVGQPPPAGEPEPQRHPARQRLVFEVESADAQVILDALRVLRAQTGVTEEEASDGVLLAAMARRHIHDAQVTEAPTGEAYRVVVERCAECEEAHGVKSDVSDTVVEEALCDALLVEMRPEKGAGRTSSTIPPRVRERVLARDHYCCTVPGCQNRLWLALHHLVHRSCGGQHTDQNLTTVCSVHHRVIHDGLIGLERRADGSILLTRNDGTSGVTHVGRRGTRSAEAAMRSRDGADAVTPAHGGVGSGQLSADRPG
jgi:5-methylcytosine-specific restriction endonuclease McrA